MVQLLDQAVVFQQRNKQTRVDHAQPGMFPADQRFRTGKDRLVLTHVKFRLVINLELALLQRTPEIIQQLLFIQFFVMKFIIIIRNRLSILVSSGVGRHLCPVKTPFNINAFIYVRIHSHTQMKPVSGFGRVIIKIRSSLLHHFFIMLTVAAIDQKRIRLQTTGKAAGFAEQHPDQIRKMAKHRVTVFLAIPFVDVMKMIDVYQDRVHGDFFVTQIKLFGITEKIFTVVESGQGILFR